MSKKNEFDGSCRYLISEPFIESYPHYLGLTDVPFEGVEEIFIYTCETFTDGKNKIKPTDKKKCKHLKGDRGYGSEIAFFSRSLPNNPDWWSILSTLDRLIYESGDHHHTFLEEFEIHKKTLVAVLGS